MYLLDVHTCQLKYFGSSTLPLYAILSHTWEDEEVTYQDVKGGKVDGKVGYEKVKKVCEIAASHGLDYAWVDTCCIDKTSSSELSEAINSMFRWYQEAAVCYAYLSDVDSTRTHPIWLRDQNSSFSRSRWHQRGFTLQELIAPRVVVFFNQNWVRIGSKSSLCEALSARTGIPTSVLRGKDLKSFSVAQKMSWASRRETSRIEDRAYSLFGIFDVHMPLLYGEGQRAFSRLQEEVIKKTNDHSIFAWDSTNLGFGGPLAPSPDEFFESYDVVTDHAALQWNSAISFNNLGINLQVKLVEVPAESGAIFAIFPCTKLNVNADYAMPLQRLAVSAQCFERAYNGRLELITSDAFRGAAIQGISIQLGHQEEKHWTPLSLAAARGDTRLMELLLENGLNPTTEQYGMTPLAKAITHERHGMLGLLLESCPNVDAHLPDQLTLLELAVSRGNEVATRMLLDAGADIRQTGQELIVQAAAEGAYGIVKILLDGGADPNQPDSADRSPLSETIKNGHYKVAHLLMNTGAHAVGRHMVEAAVVGSEDIVKLLLSRGISPNARDELDRIPLTEALFYGHEDAIRLLIRQGAYLDHLPQSEAQGMLATSSQEGNRFLVRLLLALGAKADSTDPFELSALIWAAYNGHTPTVSMLLRNGANLESRSDTRETALSYAAMGGFEDVVRMLLDNGADLESQDVAGRTALVRAIMHQHKAVAEMLLDAGASPQVADDSGRSALYLSSELGWIDLVKALLTKGARVQSDEETRYSPIAAAARGLTTDHWRVVQCLIERGADLNADSADGYPSPLISVIDRDLAATVDFLLSAGAHPDWMSRNGQTALVTAISRQSEVIVDLLLERGASPNEPSGLGMNRRSPLIEAAESGNVRIVTALLKYGAWLGDSKPAELIWAFARRNEDVLRVLLNRGAASQQNEDVLRMLLDKGTDQKLSDSDLDSASDSSGGGG